MKMTIIGHDRMKVFLKIINFLRYNGFNNWLFSQLLLLGFCQKFTKGKSRWPCADFAKYTAFVIPNINIESCANGGRWCFTFTSNSLIIAFLLRSFPYLVCREWLFFFLQNLLYEFNK